MRRWKNNPFYIFHLFLSHALGLSVSSTYGAHGLELPLTKQETVEAQHSGEGSLGGAQIRETSWGTATCTRLSAVPELRRSRLWTEAQPSAGPSARQSDPDGKDCRRVVCPVWITGVLCLGHGGLSELLASPCLPSVFVHKPSLNLSQISRKSVENSHNSDTWLQCPY